MSNSAIVPVLISRYPHDNYVARGALATDLEAHGTTARNAFETLRKRLARLAKRGEFYPSISILDAEYREHAIVSRVTDRDQNKMVNLGPKIKLTVRCIYARGEADETWCCLPDWGITFICADERQQKVQVAELVRQHMASSTTDELRLRVPPLGAELRLLKLKLQTRRRTSEADFAPLDQVAEPLSVRNRRSNTNPAWFREVEVAELVAQFREQSSTLLVGDIGCGKTTIIQAAALRYQDDERQKGNDDKHLETAGPRVWRTSAHHLIAGMQYLGQWEERLEGVIAKLNECNAILHIDNVIELVRLGGSSPEDSLAAFILPYMKRGELRLVSEASFEALDACRRLLPGFAEMFRIHSISHLSARATQDIAARMLKEATRNHRIESEGSCAPTVVGLFHRYLPYLAPPRGPAELLKRVIGESRKTRRSEIKLDDVLVQFTKETGLPEHLIRDDHKLSLAELRLHFDRSVIGQPQATQVAVDTVLKLKTGMVDPKRPVATLMFCGPTGVGKTQLARSLADYLLAGRSDGGRLIRLDMSEYQGWGAVDRLMMSPQGEPAAWIQRLRHWPLAVLLLDEFEKATPEVFDCLLSAFDEGRITDRFGRTTTLCGTVIVMTSNVGASHQSSVGFGTRSASHYQRALEQTFRPEFLNRIDSITTFQPLDRASIRLIVTKELNSIDDRPAMKDRGLKLCWNEELVERLTDVGFDPALGARPLQRQIERQVIAPLARYLLAHPQASGELRWQDVMHSRESGPRWQSGE